ncbi:MAG: cobalamin-dependent protein [Bacteroidetes bacterium]|nr:cobalamin-dependent protein [Bacteroidota bacterium]MBU1114674.1 cobalamin-dependent protein [Bacteroidota bacterium]MBU1798988.1 cobalamin-dependent protein [Bacteroidota bacterium]
MIAQVKEAYNQAIFDTDKNAALKVVYEALQQGLTPEEIVFEVIVPSIEFMSTSISQDFGANLAQHFMTAQIAAQATEELISKFKSPPKIIGRMVIGTSHGDFHGLGKKIVIGCLKANMIEAVDLGLNVTPEKFVNETIAHEAQVIGISSMMMHTANGKNGCIRVREILKERGLENKIKIIVGGAPYKYNHELYKIVHADAWAENGIEAGKIVTKLISEVRS